MDYEERNPDDRKAPLPPSQIQVEDLFAFRPAHPMPQREDALRRLKYPELYDANDSSPPSLLSRTRRLRKERIRKPWLARPQNSREILADALPIIGAAFGIIIAAILVWDGWRTVINHKYILLYEDDFSNGLDKSIWEPEIQVGGFG